MRPLAADRMRQIEEGVAKLRADIERDREQMLTLRAQLARAETTSRLAPWLGAGMALLAGLALWLWLRMRRLQREQQAQWWAASRQGRQHQAATGQSADAAPDDAAAAHGTGRRRRPGRR